MSILGHRARALAPSDAQARAILLMGMEYWAAPRKDRSSDSKRAARDRGRHSAAQERTPRNRVPISAFRASIASPAVFVVRTVEKCTVLRAFLGVNLLSAEEINVARWPFVQR